MKLSNTIKLLVFTVSIILAHSTAFSQKKPIKFGKIDMDNLKMKVYEKDTTASAIVLCDYGKSYFIYNTSKNDFQLFHERHTRIKILKKDGYEWATAKIPYYHQGSNREKVRINKGATYNLVRGKMVTTKLDAKSGVFNEEISRNWDQKILTMPNVKEGSIVEFSYVITSDFEFNYRSWTFQDEIPVLWSEYRARFLEFYDYQQLYQGGVPFHINETKSVPEVITITNRGDISGGKILRDSWDLNSNTKVHRWVVKDAPALKDETYIPSLRDYFTKIEFELEQVRFPNSPARFKMHTWQQTANELLSFTTFGGKLILHKSLKPLVASITKNAKSKDEKIVAIYNYIIKNVKWNGTVRMYAENNSKKVLENKKGNSAEINFLLMAMLREAEIAVDPVILSTRSHGRVHPVYPILAKFNYVACRVRLENNTFMLMDATNPLIPLGSLPTKCINGIGRIISPASDWVSLDKNAKFTTTVSANLTLDVDGNLKGKIATSDNGYSAYYQRKEYFKGENDFVNKAKEDLEEENEIENFKIENQNDIYKPFKISYDITSDHNTNVAADVIYLDPMLGLGNKENNFKATDRRLPVDFGFKQSETFILNLDLPEGYGVESIPANLNMALPEKGGRFLYSANVVGNRIQLMSKIDLSKTFFLPKEYSNLREFYNQVVSKHAEQIVLKKIN